jgi:3-oxoacyl-[acyl-carrier protein] reductase
VTQEQKVVLITGGSRGIGFGTAKTMAGQGWAVAITGTTSEKLVGAEAELRKLTDSVLTIQHAADNAQAWPGVIAAVAKRFGRLDALVGNAGVSIRPGGQRLRFEDTPYDVWKRTFDLNVGGVIHGFQLAVPLLKEQGGGALVAVSSNGGRLHIPGSSWYYQTSKATLISICRYAAFDLAPYGIRVNAVAPGRIDTDMARAFSANPNVSDIPLNRLGTPEEAGAAIAFLCSPAASYITGACIDVTGGWHMA